MDFSFISKTELFIGLTAVETEHVLSCSQAKIKNYQKGEYIYHSGNKIDTICIVLLGGVHIVYNDAWGNENILNRVTRGQMFAENNACSDEILFTNAVAAETSTILFLYTEKLLYPCHAICAYHSKVIRNMFLSLGTENIKLKRKISHTTSRSLRQRIISFLSFQATEQKSFCFKINFNRQQLADYLCVDRSAMSNELSKMKKDGLINYEKNVFWIKDLKVKYGV
ncbi:Crp/Fnr family transcriptional regulator [Pectinatus haikarae]|uniref:CRP-like cAMP-binding protein n=1 Tax=Pectinatus haikarae TaxID=349096 RepID=A0ABT9YBD2_9FIRM|nr:Crp/Fnr family transcriptional regulator [Pectinatus haikarae]MDQ0204999.1 CRP-like cAMP-binding protein [Pectinatus haikarae]